MFGGSQSRNSTGPVHFSRAGAYRNQEPDVQPFA